ncbi:MAG: 3-hydroxyacyl-CoA dehydrogenase NAD-binding domain-containing protein [Cyclobacteriaceae bacterium]
MKPSNALTLEKHNNVGVIWLDTPDEEWNKITIETADEFSAVMDQIDSDPQLKGIVLISRKKGFMAGADIERFLQMDEKESKEVGLQGHALLNRIEDSAKPFVAAIHGACMGGGLEISLACAARVVSDHKSTVLALPEVKLGLLPGLGGTRRLPKTIGIQKGLDAILTGKNLYAYKAHKMGLADEIVDQTKLLTAAKKLALKVVDSKFKRKDKRSFTEKFLEGNPITRNIIFKKASQIATAKSYGNYPAIPKIIESIKFGATHNREESSRKETQLFSELLSSPEAFQLINIFFGMNALKKNPLKDKARNVKAIGVLGAGLMGEGIAEVSVMNGMDILMRDINEEMLSKARKNIWGSLEKKIKYKSIIKAEAEKVINKVSGRLDYRGFEKADVVIEAVFEDLDIKHSVIAELEGHISNKCVIASNTSSLPITKIAEKSKHPENVIGMHYFSPVQKMPLLEIITTEKTADWVTATALKVGVKQGKVCIVVNDGPGFYTTRILAPFMNEALLLLEEGGDILEIDRAMKKFGFPVGPFTLMDEVGLDVGAHITKGDLGKMFEQRGGEASNLMETLSEAGFNGRKNKKGFLAYDDSGKKIKGKINSDINQFVKAHRKEIPEEEIQQRIALMMINEAVHCLNEGIIQSARDGDIGAVFGLGFPPFRGGPFRYIDAEGADKVLSKMKSLQESVDTRFTPSGIIAHKAETGEKFYQ